MAYGLTQSLDLESSSSQYASRADEASFDVTGNLTIEGWIKFESLPVNGTQGMYLAAKWIDGGGQPASYEFRVRNAAGTYKLMLSITDGTNFDNPEVDWSPSPSTGTWYHIAATYNTSTTVKFYVDGTQMGANQSTVSTSIVNSSAAFAIGANNVGGTPGNFVDGKVSLVRLWAAERTGTEINDNKCSVLGATANLRGEWTLDNVYTDNSGNGLTLTASGSPVFSADVPAICPAPVAASSVSTMLMMGV